MLLWSQLFRLPERQDLPIQTRLRMVITQAILGGRLGAGMQMPASRELAKALSLSRNTITAVYEQLLDEGLLASRPRRGIFVAEGVVPPRPDASENPFGQSAGSRPPDWAQRVQRSQTGRPTLAKPDQWQRYPYQFTYGTHDPELFPIDEFRECCVRSLSRAQLPQWAPDFEQVDVPALTEQVRQHLLPKRGVFALPEEILITVGSQHACYLLAEALFSQGTRVGFEEPGHPHARNSFAMREPTLIGLPVDAEGLVIDTMPPVDYVFVTPSHQSPTTITLSLERRHWLLRKAELQDFVIIEDDYEAENLYAGAPMPALKSMDSHGRVIYIGSFSKSLSPALRLGYIVASKELIAELRTLRHAQVRHPSTLLQHAHALFIALGHHDAHARRVNQVMQERLALASQALRQHLPGFRFGMPQGGASIWVEGPAWLDAGELAQLARGLGVLIEPGAVFYLRPPYPCPNFRLRLSSIAGPQIGDGIRLLARAVDELAGSRGLSPPGGRLN